MAQHPTNAPFLAGAGEALAPSPPRGAIHGAAAVCAAEAAVLLLRGSAVALLLSPALLAVSLLSG